VDAALELFEASGFEQTAVADIAARAGLTERTFFNCFSDKREVLFFGAEKLEAFVAQAVLATPVGTPALDVVVTALAAVIRRPDEDPAFADFARQRHALIRTYAELRERELAKLASMASATAEALRDRGVPEPTASLAAEAGVAAFKVGFQRWIDDPRQRKLRHHVHEATTGLGALVLEQAATRRATAPAPRSRGRARA
jgi:AcrR family transcriptional regulator